MGETQLRDLQQLQFASLDFASFEVLFTCFIDTEQDATIKGFVKDMIVSPRLSVNTKGATILKLLGLRQNFLDHLLSILYDSKSDVAINRIWFASTAEMAVYLCSALPELRKACHEHRNDEVSMFFANTFTFDTIEF